MTKLKILYLSPDFSNYKSAYYQQDFITTLQRHHMVYLYGPGFPEYNPSDSIGNILAKYKLEPDIICIGHGWENQRLGEPFDLHPNTQLKKCNLPKVMILNKEYKKLDEKLDYIVENQIDLVFTHHHNAEEWSQETGVKFIYWPFGVNHYSFRDYREEKRWDLSFSGSLIIKPTPEAWCSDIRVRIKNHLFYTLRNWRIAKPRYWRYQIYWGAWGRGSLFGEPYFRLLNASKVCLSTLSVIDLISPRYYEIMASKSLLFCNRSPLYKGLFEEGKYCVMFKNDLSDFDDKLFYYLRHDDERKAIVENAYRHVRAHHTWDKRVEQFTEAVQKLLQRNQSLNFC